MELSMLLGEHSDKIISILNRSWEFEEVVGNTYAIIAGFVAIGIPLAIQVAHTISEKYDNPFIVKRAMSGKIITPTTLIVATMIYIASTMLFDMLSQNSIHEEKTFFLIVLEKFVLLLFLLILLWTSVFYIRMYRKIIQPAHLFLPDLLQIKNKRKIPLAKYEEFLAGLEVLSFKVKTKLEDENIRSLLPQLHKSFCGRYFGSSNQRYVVGLDSKDIVYLKTYWSFLLNIVRIVRKAGDTELSFRTQRNLSSYLSIIFHSPLYEEIVSESYSSDTGINVRQELYELARWQSNRTDKGIDLVLECEWLSRINDFRQNFDLRYSSKGISEALEIAQSIFQLVCKERPDKIAGFYKNLMESLPFCHDIRFSLRNDGSKFWAYLYLQKIVEGNYKLTDSEKWISELNLVGSSEIYKKYGEYKVSSPFSEAELEELISSFNYAHLYEHAYKNSVELLVLQMMGAMVFCKRFDELRYCLNWRQPDSANANYVGENVFPEDVAQLFGLLNRNEGYYSDNVFFYDREGLKDYVIQASAFVLLWLKEKAKGNIIIPGLSPQEYSKSFCNILTSLSEEVIDMDRSCLELADTLKSRSNTLERAKDASIDKFEEGKAYLREYIGKNYLNRSDGFLSLFEIAGTSRVLEPEVLINRSEFKKGLANFDGCSIYISLVSHIYSHLKSSATQGEISSVQKHEKAIFFSKAETLSSLGFEKYSHELSSTSYWYHREFSGWKGIPVTESETIIVRSARVSIKATQFESGFGEYPLLFVMTQKTDSLIVETYAYFKFSIEDESILIVESTRLL